MSLKYRNSQGVETPVAGLNGQNGSLVPSVALQQSGTVNLPQQQAHSQTVNLTVTFTTPMPDTNYIVVFDTLTGNQGYRILQLQTKTVNGFKFSSFNSDVGVADATSIKWTAFKLMTDTVHEADSAHIAQNTANFAPAFSEVISYAVGDYCTYNNILYRCTTAHTAGVWVAGHFTMVTVGEDFVGQGSAPTLDNGTRIGLDKLDLRKLGLGDVQYNKIYMEVMNSNEVPGTPITGGGQTLYMKLGLIEFAIGPISADATQWSPQTLAYVRINFTGTGYSNWKEL